MAVRPYYTMFSTECLPQRADTGQQTRRGPSSLTEFEVSLADMYKGASVDASSSACCHWTLNNMLLLVYGQETHPLRSLQGIWCSIRW